MFREEGMCSTKNSISLCGVTDELRHFGIPLSLSIYYDHALKSTITFRGTEGKILQKLGL